MISEELNPVINTKKKEGEAGDCSAGNEKPGSYGGDGPYADAVVADFGVSKKAVPEIICVSFEPTGLLPLQMPKDMETVESERGCAF